MRAVTAFVGARGTDSVQLVDEAHAAGLRASGVDFVIQYLGSVTRAGVDAILAAGLAFMPVTYADRFNGGDTVTELTALALPAGTTVWLDVEGVASMNPKTLIHEINAWADAVGAAGYMPGLYVGAGCPLTSLELYALGVVRYWHSLSRVVDRNGALAEPACGWCMFQLYPSVSQAGVWSDVNFIQQDFRKRAPAWVVSD